VPQAGLAWELKVRFVSVRLKTGELEVLVTSLLIRRSIPTKNWQPYIGGVGARRPFTGVLKVNVNRAVHER
jgi:hypothetical protein